MDGVAAVGTSSLWTKQDHVHPSDTSRLAVSAFNTYSGNTSTAIGLKANIASPTFTGTVRSVTPAANDNSTCIATTAWYFGQSGNTTPVMDGTAAIGTSLRWAHADHVHPKDTAKLFLSGGTMTGVLNVCKAAQNDNTSCAASTSWYISQAGTANPLMNAAVAIGTSNLFSRQDHVHPRDTSRVAKTGDTMTGGLTIASTLNVSGATKLSSVGACQVVFGSTSCVLTGNTGMVYNPTACTLCVNYIQSTAPNAYLYADRSGDVTNATTTCCKYIGVTGTTMPAGMYAVDFSGVFGVTGANNEANIKFGIDNTVVGKNLLFKMSTASAVQSAAITKNTTSSAGTHCFDVWFWETSGTACATFGSVRVRRVC